jgi:hypothetical protein
MNRTSSQWLIIFSDLFFILVSFFVLRHQLIETPKFSSVYGSHNSGTEQRLFTSSIFNELSENQGESISIKIKKDWFSEECHLTIKGEMELKTVSSILHSSPTKLNLVLYIHPEDNPETIHEKLSYLLTSLINNRVSIDSLSILTSSLIVDKRSIAELNIVFL